MKKYELLKKILSTSLALALVCQIFASGMFALGTSSASESSDNSEQNEIAELTLYEQYLLSQSAMYSRAVMPVYGTQTQPFLIANADHLVELATLVNNGISGFDDAYYQLIANIDCLDVTMTAIGISGYPFKGNFDGNGKVISNLTINQPSSNYQGLFGYISGATITNLGIENCNVSGASYVGGLVGRAINSSTIENCYVTGVVSGGAEVGGLVGSNVVTGTLTIENCYASVAVTSTGNYVGGLVGRNTGTLTIKNCYATGTVSGTSGVGGLVGLNTGTLTIENCYATGAVTGTDQSVGGLVGSVASGTIENSVALNPSVTGASNVNRVAGSASGTLADNYAWNGMKVTGTTGGNAGADLTYTAATGKLNTQFTTIFGNDTAWDYTTDGLPTLNTIKTGTQSSNLPYAITEVAPTEIYTVADLQALATFVNAGGTTSSTTYKLMNDLDLSGVANWIPIGTSTETFKGDFDGDGHVISNLSIDTTTDTSSGNYQGLFGYTDGAIIQDLGVENCNISVWKYAGGIVGQANNTTIENCYVTGTITGIITTSSYVNVGGLVGQANNTTIKNCYVTGMMVSTAKGQGVGGLVGQANTDTTIENCYVTGTVSGNNSYVGGLIGELNNGDISIKNCYVTAEISGHSCIGGLVGWMTYSATSLNIENCYTTGAISGNFNVGGLVGCTSSSTPVTIKNSVALNPSVSMPTSYNSANRILGSSGGTNTTLTNNYAWDGMTVSRNSVVVDIHTDEAALIGVDKVHGADTFLIDGIFMTEPSTGVDEKLFETTLSFDSSDWVIPTNELELPYLKDVGDNRPIVTLVQQNSTAVEGFTITFNSNGGSAVANAITVNSNLKSMPTPTKSGYTFDGWYLDDVDFTDKVTTSTVFSADATIYAKWTEKSSSSSSTVTYTYDVEIIESSNGSVTLSTKNPILKEVVIITPKPNDGYVVASVTVTDSDGNELTVTDLENGTYSFVQGSKEVEILVEFAEETVENEDLTEKNNPFTDISTTDYYYDAIIWAWETEITTGKTAETFAPNDINSRAEAVTFLWRAVGSPIIETENPFTDISENYYYYNAVLWAVSEGITTGVSENRFAPNGTCDRAQIVTFLYRFMGNPQVDTDNAFEDIDKDSYCYDAILWAVENEVTYGTSHTSFSPYDDCTRAQIVTFLFRLLA